MSPPTTSMMGLFLQPSVVRSNFETRFLPSSKEGESVPVDTCLSFLGRKAIIKGSSNGFLLCSFELEPPHINYVICNPLTKEWRVLPRPNNVNRRTAAAFSCNLLKGTTLDSADFLVVLMTTIFRREIPLLKIATFSSKTSKWRTSTLKRDFSALVVLSRTEFVMIDKVIYWIYSHTLWAYDTTKKCLEERVEVPIWDGVYIQTWTCTLGKSKGKLYLARSNNDSPDLEIWILNKKSSGGGSEWVLCAKKRLLTALNSHRSPGSSPLSLEDSSESYGRLFSVHCIHPRDPRRILMAWRGSLYWYDLSTDKLEFLRSFKVPWAYFVYDRPVATISHPANLFSRL